MILDDVEIKSRAEEIMAGMELMAINRINIKVQHSW